MLIDDVALVGERQAAARRLLAAPLLGARTDPEAFALVRAHSDWLSQRFRRVLGYELTVGAAYARLAKGAPVGAVPAPLRDGGAPFSAHDYVHLALVLAVLVEADAQVPLARIAEGAAAAADEAGLDADPRAGAAERRSFAAALRLLARWGVVAERTGSLAAYADGRARAEEVLLDVDTELARLALAHPPHAASDPAEFTAGTAHPDPADDAAGEVALRRLLAERGVCYREDLPERQRGLLARHQWRAVAELTDLLGCEAEVRAEGIALVHGDDAGPAEGVLLPASGPVPQAALLLLRGLTARVRPATTPAHEAEVPPEVLEEELRAAVDPGSPHGRRWERGTHEYVADPDELGRRVLGLLGDAGLMRERDGGGWTLCAAAARYAAGPGPLAGSGRMAPIARPDPEAAIGSGPTEPEGGR